MTTRLLVQEWRSCIGIMGRESGDMAAFVLWNVKCNYPHQCPHDGQTQLLKKHNFLITSRKLISLQHDNEGWMRGGGEEI